MTKLFKSLAIIGLISIIFQNSIVYYIGKFHKGNYHPLDKNVVTVYRPDGDNLAVPVSYWENDKLIESSESVMVFLSYEYDNKNRNTGQIYTACIGIVSLFSVIHVFRRRETVNNPVQQDD